MVWAVEFSQAAVKTLDKLDHPVRARILRFFETRVTDDPRQVGKALVGGKRDPRAFCNYLKECGGRRSTLKPSPIRGILPSSSPMTAPTNLFQIQSCVRASTSAIGRLSSALARLSLPLH